jgi:hypothetical protein
MAETKLRVRSGQVVALRLFDLAYEINLKRAEELWAQRTQGTSARGRLVGTPPKAVSFGVPPLALELGPVAVEVAGIAMTATATVRLYDFGVAALALRLPVQDLDWPDFTRWVNATDRAIGPTATTDVWETLLAQLRRLLSEALDRPTASPPHEDYLLAVVDGLDPPLTADALLEQVDLVPLLSGEDLALSKAPSTICCGSASPIIPMTWWC